MAQLLKVIDELEAKAKAATPDFVCGADTSLTRKYIHACHPDTVLTLITALREAHEVIEFYASQKHLEKLMPGVNYDMQRADWRVSHPYVGGVEYGQTAAAFLEKWDTRSDRE